MIRTRSPSTSPVKKRQRLSSPAYDDQCPPLSQEELAAIDAIEARLSQSPKKLSRSSEHPTSSNGTAASSTSRDAAGTPPCGKGLDDIMQDDPENPFSAASSFTKATNAVAFTSASALQMDSLSSSPDSEESESAPPEQDFTDWFASKPDTDASAFQSASFGFASASSVPGGDISILSAFQTASKKLILPSSTALAKAKEKIADIWQEDDENDAYLDTSLVSETSQKSSGFKPASFTSPARTPLQPVVNSPNIPTTPTPSSGFSRPSPTTTKPSFSSPLIDKSKVAPGVKQFKSPLMNRPIPQPSTPKISSPLNPKSGQNSSQTFVSARSQHPLASSPITATPRTTPGTSVGFSSGFSSPARVAATPPRARASPAPFVTPFKAGMKPGEPGRNQLPESPSPALKKMGMTSKSPGQQVKGKEKEKRGVFNLTKPKDRKTLSSSGLLPGQYAERDLEYMGIDVESLQQLNVETALYYSFYGPMFLTPLDSPPPFSLETNELLGTKFALDRIVDRGCSRATQEWVDNHWCLILWKLVGMVGLEPERETKEETKRWCWREALHQLLYRYEREFNQGHRPPLRLIVAGDSPASYPMVLCVSKIFWPAVKSGPDGESIDLKPLEIELTDGWYRIRTQIDKALIRAVKKGNLCVGKKIVVAGASLQSEKKDHVEILEAYDSTKLVISGNGSHLAPWHEKLGFRRTYPIATMHSLTCDGGMVPSMDLLITKVYPTAFIEFLYEEGKRATVGPRSEADENKESDRWMRRREIEESKLRAEYETKHARYQSYLERLERKAGSSFVMGDDGPPDQIDSMYDELEEPDEAAAVFARVTANEAGWLAYYIRTRAEKEHERNREEIERELEKMCPPRTVHSVRIVMAQDAQTQKYPSNRIAQVTIWDNLKMILTEGKPPGHIEVGQRFLVTRLTCTHTTSWMGHEPEAQIFLCTKMQSTWRRLKHDA